MDHQLAVYPTSSKVLQLLKRQSLERCRLGYRVSTFPQLLDSLANECLGFQPTADDLTVRLLLADAISETGTGSGKSLAILWALSGWALPVIRELKSAGILVTDIERGSLSREQAAIVRRLSEIYRSFGQRLDRIGLAEKQSRQLELVLKLLRLETEGKKPPSLVGINNLTIAEVYDFTVLEYLASAALIRMIGDATLVVQARPESVSDDRFFELTFSKFVGDETIADASLPKFVRRDGRPGRLGFALTRIFGGEGAPTAPPSDDTLQIFEAPNRRAEVETVAREIRCLLESSDPPALTSIAVLARDLAVYASHIREIFPRYGLSAEVGEPLPLAATPGAKLVIGLLKTVRDGYPARQIEWLLGSPLLTHPAQHFARLLRESRYLDANVQALETCLDRYEEKLRSAKDVPSVKAEAGLKFLRDGRSPLVDFLLLLRSLDSERSAADHCRALLELLEVFGLSKTAIDVGDPANSFANWRVLETISDFDSAFRRAGIFRKFSFSEFTDFFIAVIERATFSPQKIHGGIAALSVSDARGMDFDSVFILGMDDGTFPHYRREESLLPDSARIEMNRVLPQMLRERFGAAFPRIGKLLRTSADKNSEDQFLFFLALSIPSRRMIFIYPKIDESGIPVVRSPFLQHLIGLFDGGEPLRIVRCPRNPPPENAFSSREFTEAAASNLDAGDKVADASGLLSPGILDRVEIQRRRERYLALPSRDELKDPSPGPRDPVADSFNGRVTNHDSVRRLLLGDDGQRSLSPSHFNDLAVCGFRFFAARILKLEDQDAPDYELSRLDEGLIVHEVLRALYEHAIDFDKPEAVRRIAKQLLSSFRPDFEAQLGHLEPGIVEIRSTRLERIVHELVEYEITNGIRRGFNQPPELEKEFRVPLELERDGRKMQTMLRGRIDRIEINRSRGKIDRLRVLDYKNSRSGSTYKAKLKDDNFGEQEFQLPVYVLAALEQYRDEISSTAEIDAGYIVLLDRQKFYPTDPLMAADFDLQNGRIPQKLRELFGVALGGQFDVDPAECLHYCQFGNVCRYKK